MSIINLTHHEESIYNLKKVTVPNTPKPEMYQSKFQKTNVKESSQLKKEKCATFGYAQVPLAKPSEYLKKKASEQNKNTVSVKCETCNLGPRKPPLPQQLAAIKKDPSPTTNVDYVKKNVQDVTKSAAQKPKKLTVHTRQGDKHNEEPPTFRNKPGYGKIPQYLKGVQQIKGEHLTRDGGKIADGDYCSDQLTNIGPKYVCAEEHQQLLQGLKHNWAETMKQFQLLPMITDTPSKRQHKLKLENELKQLEKDIEKLERHPVLYVVDSYNG